METQRFAAQGAEEPGGRLKNPEHWIRSCARAVLPCEQQLAAFMPRILSCMVRQSQHVWHQGGVWCAVCLGGVGMGTSRSIPSCSSITRGSARGCIGSARGCIVAWGWGEGSRKLLESQAYLWSCWMLTLLNFQLQLLGEQETATAGGARGGAKTKKKSVAQWSEQQFDRL